MIVFYLEPNTLSLPYKITVIKELRDSTKQLVYDKDGKIRKIEVDEATYYKFIPGRNVIDKEIWIKIVKYNERNWDYYSSILKIFKSKIDKTTNIEIGEDEDKINVKNLSANEMKELVENTMDINDIVKYLKYEKERTKPRPLILKIIRKRKKMISKADEALLKDKED